MEILLIILLYMLVFIIAILFFNFKWCIKTIRDIASTKNQGGYTKLIQMSILASLMIIFFVIVFYYIHYDSQVDKVDVILTVVVGWLGLIIGTFFNDRSMDSLQERKEFQVRKSIETIDKLREYKDGLLREIEELVHKKKSKKK